ncbi:hypothetical protein VCRA2118O41_80145 [Vibrio crassostreae]|nr:hypothetical protein VCHA34O109_80143 [Vibrio chagasii]CAH7293479.1 hypothetical protein VCHA38P215_50111 [Vibrio chagasii]CAK2254896.1 hypothetical protein VCRA2118O41_80145 [Vibrio crassostreae]
MFVHFIGIHRSVKYKNYSSKENEALHSIITDFSFQIIMTAIIKAYNHKLPPN